jgi:hypothetical protein
MRAFRTFRRANRFVAAMLFALALSMKLIVPQGFMPSHATGTRYLTITLCLDGVDHRTTRIAVGGEGPSGGQNDGQPLPDQHCAFTALAMGALGASALSIAPLRAAILPVRAILADALAQVGRPASLPPPSRGPPSSF